MVTVGDAHPIREFMDGSSYATRPEFGQGPSETDPNCCVTIREYLRALIHCLGIWHIGLVFHQFRDYLVVFRFHPTQPKSLDPCHYQSFADLFQRSNLVLLLLGALHHEL